MRPRKDSGVIQAESEGLGTRGADGVKISPRVEDEVGCPSSSCEAEIKAGGEG